MTSESAIKSINVAKALAKKESGERIYGNVMDLQAFILRLDKQQWEAEMGKIISPAASVNFSNLLL